MNTLDLVDLAQDDFVELFVASGWAFTDSEETRTFLRSVQSILVRRLAQAASEARDEERQQQLARLSKVSVC